MFKRHSWISDHSVTMVAILISLAAGLLPAPLQGQQEGRDPRPSLVDAPFAVPPVASIKRVARPGGLSREEAMTSRYILRTESHPVQGDAYVVVTDHRDDAYLGPLRRLAQHHGGTLLPVDDLGALADRSVRQGLARRLTETKVGYVAVAPRLESFRENMLLGLWGVLATLDGDPELDARPGLLVAPDAASFAALIDRSIAYRPTPRAAFRPFVVSQLGNGTPVGTRSLQKLGIMRELFGALGFETPGLVVRHFPGDQPSLEGKDIWVSRTAGPRRLLAEMPEQAGRAFDEASLVVMFGHGTPGMTCGMRVEAFDNRAFANKVVLCGSCMSAAPMQSDWRKMDVGPDGSEVVADRTRFLMEAVERGAVVTYAHMRFNAGFPHVFPVVESLLRGETVGEAYQRLIDGLLTWTRLQPDELVLSKSESENEMAAMRRNQVLYVLVGDPALRPLEPLAGTPTPARASDGPTD
jgi:hypothetical protein